MDSSSLYFIVGRHSFSRVCIVLRKIHKLVCICETWQNGRVRQYKGFVSVHRASKQHAVHVQYVAPSLPTAFAERLDRENLHRLVVDLQHLSGSHLPRQYDGHSITSCRQVQYTIMHRMCIKPSDTFSSRYRFFSIEIWNTLDVKAFAHIRIITNGRKKLQTRINNKVVSFIS